MDWVMVRDSDMDRVVVMDRIMHGVMVRDGYVV